MKKIFCAIATRTHLSYARTLAESLYKTNLGAELIVLIAELGVNRNEFRAEPFKTLFLEDLDGLEMIRKMRFYYTAHEFCNSMKAYLHDYLFNHTDYQKWIYLDADIFVLDSLAPLFSQLDEQSILLSAHYLHPLQDQRAHEESFLRLYGLYNGGFMGICRDTNSAEFIQWWKKRITFFAFNKISHGQYGEQGWLDFVFLFFKRSGLTRLDGVNVARWNLFERDVRGNAKLGFTTNGTPLLFFHFSAFDIAAEDGGIAVQINEETTRENHEAVKELVGIYKQMLIANGHHSQRLLRYDANYFSNGRLIWPLMRKMYYEELRRNKRTLKDPFDCCWRYLFQSAGAVIWISLVNFCLGTKNFISKVSVIAHSLIIRPSKDSVTFRGRDGS